jgi:hypothetical protein
MSNSRRKFLQNSALLLAGASVKPSYLLAQKETAMKKLIGIQLYSVRADMFKNPLATLKALSKMGYEYVEHANYVDRKL